MARWWLEYWQPLFFDHTETLFDHAADETQLLVLGDVETAVDSSFADVAHRYNQRGAHPITSSISARTASWKRRTVRTLQAKSHSFNPSLGTHWSRKRSSNFRLRHRLISAFSTKTRAWLTWENSSPKPSMAKLFFRLSESPWSYRANYFAGIKVRPSEAGKP